MSWKSQGNRKNNFPVFVNNLWKILENGKHSDIVQYRCDDSFEILNVSKFTHIILPHYYKTTNMKQYYKQLEKWGFRRPYDKLPIFIHPKWDKTNKNCLNQMSKIQTTQIISTSVSHHLRTNTSMYSIEARLDDEIKRREALQSEVVELKKIVHRLMKSSPVTSSPTVNPIDHQTQHGKRKSPSTKRSLGTSAGSPEKRRKTTPTKVPEITSHDANGRNPLTTITNIKPFATEKSEPKPRRFALTDIMHSRKQLPTMKDIPLFRPTRPSVEYQFPLDCVSLKTEVLQAQFMGKS